MADPLRLYLLSGLLLHKAVWEVLKQRPRTSQPRPAQPFRVHIIKAAKVAILLSIVVQTAIHREFLPITSDATLVRAIGTAIYTGGLAIALVGRLQLGSNWADIEVARVLRAQQIVSTGLYR